MTTAAAPPVNPAENTTLAFLRKNPWVGIMAMLTNYAIIPVMHIAMTGIAHWLEVSQFNIGLIMGLIGVGMIYVGTQKKNELYQTWMGYFAGNLIFTGWIEFGNDWWALHLGVQPNLRADGSTELLAGMRVFQVGSYFFACVAIVLMFNKETYCRAVVWLRKWLRMSVGLPTPGYERNFALITAWEIIAVTWCLFQFKRFAPALRYGIPVSIILWVPVEIAAEWRLFEEAWAHPWKYKLECGLIIAAMLVVFVMARYTTKKRIPVEELQRA